MRGVRVQPDGAAAHGHVSRVWQDAAAMIRQCPRCGGSLPWRFRLWGSAGRCGHCSTPLKRLEPGRRTPEFIAWMAMDLGVIILVVAVFLGIGGFGARGALGAIIGLPVLILLAGWIGQKAFEECAVDGPHCPECLYPWAGITADKCPECGAPTATSLPTAPFASATPPSSTPPPA
jgi:hypothetical protein